MLRDNDGPVDMSREELIDGEGGFDGVESRWLEGVTDHIRRAYLRAKGSSIPELPKGSYLFVIQIIKSSMLQTRCPQT